MKVISYMLGLGPSQNEIADCDEKWSLHSSERGQETLDCVHLYITHIVVNGHGQEETPISNSARVVKIICISGVDSIRHNLDDKEVRQAVFAAWFDSNLCKGLSGSRDLPGFFTSE